MLRRVTLFLSVVSLMALLTPSILAAQNVIHYPETFSEYSSMPLNPELVPCVGYNGTIIEERFYDVRVTEFVDGPRAGRIHLTGVIIGDFRIEPDDTNAGPVYEGTYREKVTFIGTSFDDPILVSFSLPATATSADGTTLKFLMHGHGVIGQDGQPRVVIYKTHCIR